MSKKGQNFLQSWWDGYKNFDPAGAIQNRMDEDKVLTQERSEYLEDQYLDRVDPTNSERGVKPSMVESVLLGVDRNEFSDAGGRIKVRGLKKTDVGEQAEALGLEIKPTSNESKLQRRVDRKKQENQYNALATKNPDLDVSTLSDSQLTEEIRKSTNTLQEQEKYGVAGPDGKTRTGGSIPGQMEIERFNNEKETHDSGLDLNQETIASSRAATNLAAVTQRNNQNLALYDRDVDKYRYDDGKVEAQIERDWQAGRDDAQFAANLETIKLQNAAEMERYEMMLQNDKEVRQGESISDLMSALSMLGGSFML